MAWPVLLVRLNVYVAIQGHRNDVVCAVFDCCNGVRAPALVDGDRQAVWYRNRFLWLGLLDFSVFCGIVSTDRSVAGRWLGSAKALGCRLHTLYKCSTIAVLPEFRLDERFWGCVASIGFLGRHVCSLQFGRSLDTETV